MMNASSKRPPITEDTRSLLRDAAADEFNSVGFNGTDTNRIARRAGFSPQTFYRHYKDKADVFVAVYEEWAAQEEAALLETIQACSGRRPKAFAKNATKILIRHHSTWAVFRRSLRFLTTEDQTIRAARAKSRNRQADQLAAQATHHLPRYEILAAVLSIEALCDAQADGITSDLQVDRSQWEGEISRRLMSVLGP